jgi:hypothetical protein
VVDPWFGTFCHLLEMDWENVVHHFYNEVNQCTYVANFGCSLNFDIVYYESCHIQFNHLLVVDIT